MKSATLITGASSGLGSEFARLFAADNHDLVLTARRKDRLETLASEVSRKFGVTCHAIEADLQQPDAPAMIARKIQELHLHVDHLVNNAGFGYVGDFASSNKQQDLGMIEVNVTALVHLTKLFIGSMKHKGFGRILNIGSTAGFQPGPYMTTYYATKAFVNSFSEALAFELQGSGVTVTLSCPGPTATEFGERSGVDKKPLFKMGTATSESVARQAYEACIRGDRRVIHGMLNKVGAVTAGFTPNALLLRMVERIQGPQRQ